MAPPHGTTSASVDPRCSLITVTYNSRTNLQNFWSAMTLSPRTEWIVVDNGSTDGSPQLAEQLGAKVLPLQRNIGFARANNLGLEVANADFIGFVNPDLSVREEDIPKLEQTARKENAIVSPQLVNPDQTLQPNGRGYPLLTAKVRNRLLGDDTRYLLFGDGSKPRPVCWLMGAALFASRDVITRINGWDPHFFLYYEDKDICLRAWRAGIPVLLVPQIRWIHAWGRETAHLKLMPWKRELASMLKFYGRYPEFLLGTRASRRAHPEIESMVFGADQ